MLDGQTTNKTSNDNPFNLTHHQLGKDVRDPRFILTNQSKIGHGVAGAKAYIEKPKPQQYVSKPKNNYLAGADGSAAVAVPSGPYLTDGKVSPMHSTSGPFNMKSSM